MDLNVGCMAELRGLRNYILVCVVLWLQFFAVSMRRYLRIFCALCRAVRAIGSRF